MAVGTAAPLILSWFHPRLLVGNISPSETNGCNYAISVRREKALVHSGSEWPARELDRSTR